MTPEQQAREIIDRKLTESGWILQSQRELNISAGLGIAVREFKLKSGYADYLYAGGKVIGVIEAKPVGHTLKGVEPQSSKYTDGLPDSLPCHSLPLPFAYESTGEVTQFTNSLKPVTRSHEVFAFQLEDEPLSLMSHDGQCDKRRTSDDPRCTRLVGVL